MTLVTHWLSERFWDALLWFLAWTAYRSNGEPRFTLHNLRRNL